MKTTTIDLENSRLAPGGKMPPDIAALNAETTGELALIESAPRAKNVGYTGISADVIQRLLREQAKATEDEIGAVLWLHGHGRETRVPTLEALGRLIGYGEAVLSQLFRGTYKGNITAVVAQIESYRRDYTGRAAFGEDPILDDLSPTKAIGDFCERARHSGTIGILWSDSHTGKTRGLRRHADRNNHGRTVFVSMPPGGGSTMFMVALMRACGISERNSYAQMMDRAVGFLNRDKLLLVDQMHRTISGRKMQIGTLDMLVHLYDETGCGMVLSGTPVFLDTVQDDRLRKWFEQVDNRGVLRLKLPRELPYQDARALGLAYGLPAPDRDGMAIIRGLVKAYRLGKLVKLFKLARKFATEENEPFGWVHVTETIETLSDWAAGEGIYGGEGAK